MTCTSDFTYMGWAVRHLIILETKHFNRNINKEAIAKKEIIGFSRGGIEQNTEIHYAACMKHMHTTWISDPPNSWTLSSSLLPVAKTFFCSTKSWWLRNNDDLETVSCIEQWTPFKVQIPSRLGFFAVDQKKKKKAQKNTQPRKYFRDLNDHEEDGENEQGSIFNL